MKRSPTGSGARVSLETVFMQNRTPVREVCAENVSDLLQLIDNVGISKLNKSSKNDPWSFFDILFLKPIKKIRVSQFGNRNAASEGLFVILLLSSSNVIRDARSIGFDADETSDLAIDSDVVRAIVACKPSGTGRPSIRMDLAAREGEPDTVQVALPDEIVASSVDAPTDVKDGTADERFLDGSIKRADGLRTSGRPNEALKLAAELDPTVPAVRLLKVRLYHRLKLHEEILSLYATLSSEEKFKPAYFVPALQALVNLRKNPQISSLLLEFMLSTESSRLGGDVLLRIFPFATLAPDAFQHWIRGAIAAKSSDGRSQLGHLLHFAHTCLDTAQWRSFHEAYESSISQAVSSADLARIDVLRAQLAFICGDYDLQERYLNDALARTGIDPIRRRDDAHPITASNVAGREATRDDPSGPLISVVMTTYNREDSIRYAAESVLNQSWRKLELIIVDDASSDRTVDVVKALGSEDSRIKLICLTDNGGTYVAKNHGLLQAAGEFVTCQDSDDWAHPDKLRFGVRPLLESSQLVASTVQHVRCNAVQGFKSRLGYIRKDFSSFLFRREAVITKVGYFDSVRAGADAELQMRIERTFGAHATVSLPHLLSIVDWGVNSLTGGGTFGMDDEVGYMSPLRTQYRKAFLKWHETGNELYVPFPHDTRAFDI